MFGGRSLGEPIAWLGRHGSKSGVMAAENPSGIALSIWTVMPPLVLWPFVDVVALARVGVKPWPPSAAVLVKWISTQVR